MNADVLLEHFHRLGDAPDAVPRLRRFMLQLAVEGAFQTEAQLLTWTAKPLGDLCEFKGGLWKGKKPPFVKAKVLRVTNITKDCEMNVENAIELDVEVKQLASRRLTPGDIIIEKSGGGDNQPVGRVALFTETEGVYSFSNFTTVMRIVDHKLIAPDFLHDFLRSFYFIGGTLPLQNNATNLRNLQLGEYKQVVIPLPPLPEQQRIVAKVDELMALCDRLEAALERREATKAKLLEALLQVETSSAPRPPQVRQHPATTKTKTQQATYPEPEDALPLAAEPVHQRRGPGRPRKAGTQDLGAIAAAIAGYLQAHPGWHARSAILPGAGIAANTWNAAINALLEAGKVERQGKRKGARYRVKK